MATAKHKFQKLVFNPANWKLVDFLDELQKLAKDAFVIAVYVIIEQFVCDEMPPQLQKSKNQAQLEEGTYEQIVTNLERELELNGLEDPDELQINAVSQQPTNVNPDRPNQRATIVKNQNITKITVFFWKNSANKLIKIKIILKIETVTPTTLTQPAMSTKIITTTTKTVTEPRENQKLSTHPGRHVEK